MREFVRHIATSLRNDDHWKEDDHWVASEKLGMQIWSCNGFFFLRIRWWHKSGHATDINLSLLEKVLVAHALHRFRAAAKRRKDAAVLQHIVEHRLTGGSK